MITITITCEPEEFPLLRDTFVEIVQGTSAHLKAKVLRQQKSEPVPGLPAALGAVSEQSEKARVLEEKKTKKLRTDAKQLQSSYKVAMCVQGLSLPRPWATIRRTSMRLL